MPEPPPSAVVVDTSRSPHARLRPVPLDAVTLADGFLQPRRARNAETTLPSQFQQIEETARLDNFRRASGRKTGINFEGIYFNDSDVYKWLEGAASTLPISPDTDGLRRMIATAVDEVAAAQEPNGYLDTYYMFDKAKERFTNLRDMHELYCAGHLFQAGVAHFRATGERSLLDVCCRLADLLCETFGDEDGKRPGACGHPEAEMALVELYRATGEERYLKLAEHMIDVRGRKPSAIEAKPSDHRYMQDHVSYRDLKEVTGHAVRMIYLACGAADVYLETGAAVLWDALMAQWDNLFEKRMYVSGGLGARYEGEAFGKDYELPNTRAYTETCAAIASVMWNHRLLAATADPKFADLLEHTLYNAVLPGLSLSGDEYYYQNPLADDGKHRRQKWFGCACCPPNVARLLPQLSGYFYSTTDASDVYMHLYAEGTARIALPNGQAASLAVQTRYPWDGEVTVTVQNAGEFGLFLRVPYWCAQGATLAVNGEAAQAVGAGTYAEVRRTWAEGDTVTLHLPMPVRRLQCHPYVTENAGQVALMRGPILYCLEAADAPDGNVSDLVLPDMATFETPWEPEVLGGIVALDTTLHRADAAQAWGSALYREHAPGPVQPAHGETKARFVPYYAWANRVSGAMRVWVRSA